MLDKEKSRFSATAKGTDVLGKICDFCIFEKGKYASFGEQPNICTFTTDVCANQQPSYFFNQRDKNAVVIFSKLRVPWDKPKSRLELIVALKKDIIAAVRELKPFENGILKARYGTTEKSFYDVENALFYNIGTTNFKPFTQNGVVFSVVNEQEIIEMRKKYNIPDDYTHYYEYQLTEPSKKEPYGSTLAEWADIPIKCLGLTSTKCWHAIKENIDKIKVYDKIDCGKKDTFGINLHIQAPENVRFSLITALKPLLDGLICAFHGSQFDEEKLTELSQKLKCDKSFLIENTINVLGKRKGNVVQLYRNGVKWNPADDLCNYVSISVTQGSNWSVSGKIYSTVKCPKCGKGQLSKLLWGAPAVDEMMKQEIESKKIRIAGCCVEQEKARYYCRWCKKTF